MERDDYRQLELFSQARERAQRKTPLPQQLFAYIRLWERGLLIIIGLVITGIISYSLGVERGKKISRIKTDSRLDVALKIQKRQVPKPQSYTPSKEEVQEYLPNYTIQVASFLNKTNAEREADTLKKKGLSSLVLPKGRFTIVCVGNFSNREEAESFLIKMRKQYQDCRIRKL